MKKSIKLKQDRALKLKAQTDLIEKIRAENREYTPEEEKLLDDGIAEVKTLDAQIEREEKLEALELRQKEYDAIPVVTEVNDGEGTEKNKLEKRYSITRAMRLARKGNALDGVEKEMNEIAINESREAKVGIPEDATINIPIGVLRSGQSVSEDAGDFGGKLVVANAPIVQTAFSPRLFLETLGATRLSGLSGGDVPLPVFGNYKFGWYGETDEIKDQKTKIVGPVLSPKRLGAAVPISNLLIMQSSISVDAMVMGQLRVGYETALQLAAINGSGVNNEPTGLLNNSGVQTVTHAVASPSWAHITELQGLVEVADSTEENLGYLMDPQLRSILKRVTKDAGSGRFLLEGKEIDGYLAVSTSLVPTLGGNKVLIYGDWSQMFIGEWGSISMIVNPWTKIKQNSLEVVVNAHADVQIAQAKAFAVDKFLKS